MTRIDPSLTQTIWDLAIVGGGATGLGVALQAALQGHRVLLIEQRDFASGTSSRSTKLLHGGVRYLAQGHWSLVTEALRERTTVLGLAPHLAQPLSFVVVPSGPLSWWRMGIGLKLYQWLSGRMSLGPTRRVTAAEMDQLLPRRTHKGAGLRYWDGQFEDARYALSLAQSARDQGATLLNHMQLVGLRAQAGQAGWQLALQDALDGARLTVQARAVVNATGVWVDEVRSAARQSGAALAGSAPSRLVRPSQGVHIVVPHETLPLREAVLIPETEDGRVLFAIPWLGSTVIGTTDTEREDAPKEPRPTPDEIQFLLRETERWLGVRLSTSDVRSVWVGLRPLVQNPSNSEARSSQVSREHVILRESPGLVTVTGGKWTTYRRMAEQVLDALRQAGDLPAPLRDGQTRTQVLHGSPRPGEVVSLHQAPGLHLWGTQAAELQQAPGASLGMGLTEAMVRHSARHEWAVTVEDMLARRWRALFLDAREAERMAPEVARILQDETGLDPQLAAFMTLCRQYRL